MEASKQPAALIIIDDDDGDYGQRFTVNENKQTAKDVIVIPDDEDETEREQASRTVSVYSPKKNFKISEKRIQKLQALVKVNKLNLSGNGNAKTWKIVNNGELAKPAVSSATDKHSAKFQVGYFPSCNLQM